MIPTFRPDAAHALLDDPAAWNAWVDRLETATGTAVDDLSPCLTRSHARYARFAAARWTGERSRPRSPPDLARDPALADAVIRRARAGAAGRRRASLGPARGRRLAARLAARSSRAPAAPRAAAQRVAPASGRSGPCRRGRRSATTARARASPGCSLRSSATRPAPHHPLQLNPADNALFATLAGAFSRPGVAQLVQWGPPWWFNDHEDGMRRQLDVLSRIGQLAGFVGMVTDSRSLLSMTRHELFRRFLCDAVGRDVDEGRIPADPELLGGSSAGSASTTRCASSDSATGPGDGRAASSSWVSRGRESRRCHRRSPPGVASRSSTRTISIRRQHREDGFRRAAFRRRPLAVARGASHGHAAEEEAVVTCSALKRAYRDALRSCRRGPLPGSRGAARRVRPPARRPNGHFMPTAMVDSQFAALEAPAPDEIDSLGRSER